MTETVKHTPLPWRAVYSDEDGKWLIRSDFYTVAADLDEADAALIVRAVNSHARLLDACKRIQRRRERNQPIQMGDLDAIDAAIEAAESK